MRPDAMTTPPDPTRSASAEEPAPEEPPPSPASWRRLLPRRRPSPQPAGPGEEPTTVIPAPPTPERPGALRRRRRTLIDQRQDAVYHLGGLAFELHRRDLLAEEVMRRRAGEVAALDDSVRDIDIRLGELDRERRERRARPGSDAASGCCVHCRASFRAEARFCSNCGVALLPPSHGDEQPTATIAPLP